MHVLVTGGAGFIGSHIVEFHLERGDQVLVVDNLSTGSLENLEDLKENPNLRIEQQDVLTWSGLDDAVGWADRVYHMAAVVGLFRVLEEPISVLAVNIAGAERLLRSIHRSRWDPDVIMASTSEVYGNRFHYSSSQTPPDEENPQICPSTLVPCGLMHNREHGVELSEDMELMINSSMNARSNYSLSKLADELYGLSYYRQYGLRVRMIRFFNVIGPRQTGKYGMVVPRFVSQAVTGKAITVFGDGQQTRCFMDVRDAVRVLHQIAETRDSVGQVINVGGRDTVTIEELAFKVKQCAGSTSDIVYMPYQEAYGEGFDEIYHRKPSLRKLKSLIEYAPEWNLERTLVDLVNHIKPSIAVPTAG